MGSETTRVVGLEQAKVLGLVSLWDLGKASPRVEVWAVMMGVELVAVLG